MFSTLFYPKQEKKISAEAGYLKNHINGYIKNILLYAEDQALVDDYQYGRMTLEDFISRVPESELCRMNPLQHGYYDQLTYREYGRLLYERIDLEARIKNTPPSVVDEIRIQPERNNSCQIL
jgi:hypothetical protein